MENNSIRRVAIVMAGGSGERFWPLSRLQRPKQLLHLTRPDQTMLQEAVSRLAPIIPREDIYIATARHLVDVIRKSGVGVPDENVIAEPCKRNTTGCLAYAAAHVLAKYSESGSDLSSPMVHAKLSMTVVTADPAVGDEEAFRQTILSALNAAETHGALGVIGVVPSRPETGYGYVQIPSEDQPLSGFETGVKVYPVSRFHEKPSREAAEEFIATGRYYWNSGMFFWNIATFMRELTEAKPEIAASVIQMANAMRIGDDARVEEIFAALENIAIDYALMERARNVVMARAEFPWDDVGAWPALERTQPRDGDGNVLLGNPVAVDCKNCIVYDATDATSKDMAVAVVGAEDLVVVVTDDAILVIPKDRAQDVRRAVSELQRRNAKQV
jgi:mannose-1-phosphate guanylyltransferase